MSGRAKPLKRGRSRPRAQRLLGGELLGEKAVQDAVDPLVVAPVRPSAHALAREAGAFGVAHGALVEPVDLHLHAVIAEVVEEVALEESRGSVGHLRATEVGVDRKTAEVCDPASSVPPFEAHRPGALAVRLDDEDAEGIRLAVGAGDLGEDLLASLRAHGREVRLDVLVADELDEEVGVVRACAPDRDHYAGSSCTRTPNRRWPEASATPSSMSASPVIATALTGSSSSAA